MEGLIYILVITIILYLIKRNDEIKIEDTNINVCSIMCGINDGFQYNKLVDYETSIKNLDEMIKIIKSNKFIPVVGIYNDPILTEYMTQDRLDRIQKIKNGQIEYCKLNNITMIDFSTVMKDNLTNDYIHPNENGYKLMGEEALKVLNSLNATNLIAYGDSITAGYPYSDLCPNVETDKSWTSYIRNTIDDVFNKNKKSNLTYVINRGIGGQTSTEILVRMKNDSFKLV